MKNLLTSTLIAALVATTSFADGNPPPPPPPPPAPEQPETSSSGGGGSDLAGPLLLLGVIALIAIHNSKPRPITNQECLVEGKLDVCLDPIN